MKILLQAREAFRMACGEIAAPGWALPDLFRVFLVGQEAKDGLGGGVWWGNRVTAFDGFRAKALKLESALRDAEPGAEVEMTGAFLDPAYSIGEQPAALEFDNNARAAEDGADAEARRFLAQAYVQVLHPTPLRASSADVNGLALVVEALRRVTMVCDLELFAMGFGEVAVGMVRLARGRAHAAPVLWPLDGGQVSCLVPLDHDNLAYLLGHTWAVEGQAKVYGLEDADFHRVSPETVVALEPHRSRLGVALATKPAALRGGGVWAQLKDRQWADVGVGGFVHALIQEDKQNSVISEEVQAWEDYWAVRKSFAELMRQVAAMEAVPQPTGSRSKALSRDAWKVRVGRGNAALNFEVGLLENNGLGGFEDGVEHGVQARVLKVYAPRVLDRLAAGTDLRHAAQVDPLKMAIAVLVLGGVQPDVPLGEFFPALGARLCDDLLPEVGGIGSAASLARVADPGKVGARRYSADRLWVYQSWGGETDGRGNAVTGYFQAISVNPVGHAFGFGLESPQIGDRILAQKEFCPGRGIPPSGKWLMLSKEPFFG